MSHPFGNLLGQYLHRKHGLSQFKLAAGIDQPPSVISEMCQGKRLTGAHARERVAAILQWLRRQGVSITKQEADDLFEAAGLAPSRENEIQGPPSRFDRKRPAAALRHNLPEPFTPLIGREKEIDEIVELLDRPGCRLLTLNGQGGIGKTRLAIQAALQIAANSAGCFPDGIFFSEVQPGTEPAYLAQAILTSAGLPIHGTGDPRTELLQFLKEREILLLLDNFEEALRDPTDNAAATLAFLGNLIQHAPRVKVLVTSRIVLNLSEEWIYPVRGLSFPLPGPDEPAEAARLAETRDSYPAVRLFIERARRVQRQFDPAEEMQGIIQICQLVEGLPLALEMAAAWTKIMSCVAIAAEIQRTLVILESRYQDIPARHRSMLAVIDQSWQGLAPEVRRAYLSLSVFRGGFERQAAEQVAGASLAILSALVDASFLRWEPDGRYHVHELLRQFARDQLQAGPEAALAAYQTHTMFFADFLEKRAAAITGPRQQVVLREISAELQNIRAAWRQAVEESNLVALQKAAYTFYQFCDFTGRYLEGEEGFEQAIASLAGPEGATPQAAEVLAVLYPLLGYLAIRLGKFERARQAFQSGLELLDSYQLAVRPEFGTDPSAGLGLLALVKGEYAAAIQLSQAARGAALARKDPLNHQIACYVLACAAFAMGDTALALAQAEESLAATESTGNRWMKGQILSVQGQIARAQNQYALAQQKYQDSYLIKHELNDPEGEANALNQMAALDLLRGSPAEAHQLYRKSLEIFLRINDPGGLGSTYAGLGDTALAQADPGEACRSYKRGLQIALQIQWLPLVLALLAGISVLLLQAGQVEMGVRTLSQVLAHSALTADIRARARQALERALAGLPASATLAVEPPARENEDAALLQTARRLLVELGEMER